MNFGIDRTAEFLQALQPSFRPTENGHSYAFNPLLNSDVSPIANGISHQRINLIKANSGVVNSGGAGSRLRARSQFASVAALIGNDLAVTCGRLESLGSLARQRTLFDDHSTEVQHLTLLVKEDIANLNHRIADLQNISKHQSSQNKQSAKHSSSILMSLQTRLASMSDKFKQVLEQRSTTLQVQAARKNQFSSRNPVKTDSLNAGQVNAAFTPDNESMRLSYKQPVVVPSILLQDEQRARESADGIQSAKPVHDFAGSQLAQQLMYRDQTEAYLTSRSDTVRTIEHTIVQLGEIFQQLATMVQEQGESVQRIDANVEDATNSVEAGHHELLRYFRSVSSNRWLMVKVFGILIFFFIIFVIFFV